MKKGVLILLGMFMMVSTVEAKNGNELPNRNGFYYSYNNAVNFIERGVEFFIFTNGEFDFNTHYNDSYFDYNRRRTSDRGINIDRDYRGRINRIGNSFINYDRHGNVTRIGNVFMRYYRGKLTNVGNLRVNYNRWGDPIFYGKVKNNFYSYNGIRFNLNIGDICNYNDSYFSHRDFRRNYSQIREDNNFYYYRAKTNAKIGKRSKILRRRKPASVKSKRKSTIDSRRNKNTYRKPSSVSTKRKSTVVTKRNTSRKPISVDSRRKVTKNKRNNNSSYRRSDKATKNTNNKKESKSIRKRRS